jgi:hypothetical protein
MALGNEVLGDSADAAFGEKAMRLIFKSKGRPPRIAVADKDWEHPFDRMDSRTHDYHMRHHVREWQGLQADLAATQDDDPDRRQEIVEEMRKLAGHHQGHSRMRFVFNPAQPGNKVRKALGTTWSELLLTQNPGSHWVTREGKHILVDRGGAPISQAEIERARSLAPSHDMTDIPDDWFERQQVVWKMMGATVEQPPPKPRPHEPAIVSAPFPDPTPALSLKRQAAERIASRLMGDKAIKQVEASLQKHFPGWDAEAGTLSRSLDPETRRTENAIGAMLGIWRQTTGDNDPLAVALQTAAQQEFGIPDNTLWFWQSTKQKALAQYGDCIVGMRHFLRAMYDETQLWFRLRGITHVPLARGAWWDAGKRPGWVGATPLYRPGEATVRLQPMSAFTAAAHTADYFSKLYFGKEHVGDTSLTVAGNVPVSRILSVPVTGFGSIKEQEMVMLGGDVDMVSYAYRHQAAKRTVQGYLPGSGKEGGWTWQIQSWNNPAYRRRGDLLMTVLSDDGKSRMQFVAPIGPKTLASEISGLDARMKDNETERRFITEHAAWVRDQLLHQSRLYARHPSFTGGRVKMNMEDVLNAHLHGYDPYAHAVATRAIIAAEKKEREELIAQREREFEEGKKRLALMKKRGWTQEGFMTLNVAKALRVRPVIDLDDELHNADWLILAGKHERVRERARGRA